MSLTFEAWCQKLYQDAMSEHERRILINLGDYVLRLFWERGVSPTIEGLTNDPLLEKVA